VRWIVDHNVKLATVAIFRGYHLAAPNSISGREVFPEELAEGVLSEGTSSSRVSHLGSFSKLHQ
jgi:hypothetical protein